MTRNHHSCFKNNHFNIKKTDTYIYWYNRFQEEVGDSFKVPLKSAKDCLSGTESTKSPVTEVSLSIYTILPVINFKMQDLPHRNKNTEFL